MLIFDKTFRSFAHPSCSVSWISDYCEFEWVFARSFWCLNNEFELQLVHDDGKIQVATVKKHGNRDQIQRNIENYISKATSHNWL